MRRRALLGTAVSTVATLAGCSSSMDTVESDESQTATNGRASFGQYTCPPYELDKPAVCSRGSTPDGAGVYTTPSARVLTRPMKNLQVTLHNARSKPVEFNSGNWNIHTNRGSGWRKVEQTIVADGKVTLTAGESRTWSLSSIMNEYNDTYQFQPGDYSVALSVFDPKRDEYVACISLFRVKE